jgi:RNA polymerase sigma-70 factor (ECF subfamily)
MPIPPAPSSPSRRYRPARIRDKSPSSFGRCEEKRCLRLRGSDADASREVFERFFRRIVGLARARLDRRLSGKVDAETVASSVLATFFRRSAAGEFVLNEWTDLWRLLATITMRKCLNRARGFLNQGRDVSREIDVEDVQLLDREPSPDEEIIVRDLLDKLLLHVAPDERAVIERSLQGHEVTEIVAGCVLSERTVVPIRERFRRSLEKETLHDRDE